PQGRARLLPLRSGRPVPRDPRGAVRRRPRGRGHRPAVRTDGPERLLHSQADPSPAGAVRRAQARGRRLVTLDERILAYLDGSSTPAETAELNSILDSDRAARDRFARLCEQDGALRQILTCAPATPKSRRGARRATTGPAAPWAAIAFVAAGL